MRGLIVFLFMAGTGFSQSITGFIDGYYGYNFNKPSSRKNLYHNFDFNHNQFSLNYAELTIEQKPSPLGFRADIGFGDTAKAVHSAEPGGVDVYQYLQQIYFSAAHKSAQFDFGKFVTPLGAEVIETRDNWNYTRSLLFALAIPYYHFGVRTTLTVKDKLGISLFAVNGWNNVVDNNAGKSTGIQAVVKPAGWFTFTQNYMVGNELADGDGPRHLIDSVATLNITSKLSFMANYDYGMDRRDGDRVRWQGAALYARVSPVSKFRISPRVEWFYDANGFMTGTPQALKEGTLTTEVSFHENLLLRGEYRRDLSDQSVFEFRNAGTRSHQDTFAIGVVYSYSKK